MTASEPKGPYETAPRLLLFRRRFRDCCEGAGLRSRERIARALGCAPSAVDHWASGLRIPSAVMLVRMADLFDVTPGWLLGYEACDEARRLARIAWARGQVGTPPGPDGEDSKAI